MEAYLPFGPVGGLTLEVFTWPAPGTFVGGGGGLWALVAGDFGGAGCAGRSLDIGRYLPFGRFGGGTLSVFVSPGPGTRVGGGGGRSPVGGSDFGAGAGAWCSFAMTVHPRS